MPFIPHTENEVREMLDAIGVESIEQLFDEIPDSLRIHDLPGVPDSLSEMAISRLMHERAAQDGHASCFIGAGAYEHHIPAAVWEITTRGEYYSAYTPYQAEASQGTLQLIYEYQSMMTELTAMDVSNASLYDGATALAEASLMAVRANRKSKSRKILVPRSVHPLYRQVTQAIAGAQELDFQSVDFEREKGSTPLSAFKAHEGEDITAVVIPQPNFFGSLEEVDAITDWAHENGALVIAVVNPTSLAVIEPPGNWGEKGADIMVGEGQPLGVPLSSGGPYFGILCCSQKLVRQMPGRLVGRTVDEDGKEGFTLTLQPREQHIRRSKATSNICTNQGLMVTAATIYMALLGAEGLARVAAVSHQRTRQLRDAVSELNGVNGAFDSPYFHETVIRLDRPADKVLDAMAERGVLGGLSLKDWYPELGEAILVCATETKTEDDIRAYRDVLGEVLASVKAA
ncbi:glycine dehydrogenase subunit 1 [Natronospira proteinivora]|uniref:Probable glycine dehydrogenase (decarboxylating) subunit 1 n=1 Tax=Natronospira proteinivora TaxID=1807133 RepID=A0ABT1G837_9GAMM|nr:aminomethyl-transferring glycine dehydrogenase subunit GcvPA [Natronospira proteinivora]MCP1727455.1 glycine dehydrogenase subunit 1 [Natronospira proteinivora]